MIEQLTHTLFWGVLFVSFLPLLFLLLVLNLITSLLKTILCLGFLMFESLSIRFKVMNDSASSVKDGTGS